MADKHTADNAASTAAEKQCSSCERCRTRKTKCDGKRPCGNCAERYMKINKCEDIEGVDFACFDCIYSVAKRRGPVPGRSAYRHLTHNGGLCPVKAEGNVVMGGLGLMGYPNGFFPLGLNGVSEPVALGAATMGGVGSYGIPSTKEAMHTMLASGTVDRNTDFVTQAVEVARGVPSANISNLSFGELIQQRTMLGLFEDQQQRRQHQQLLVQLHSNITDEVGPAARMIGGTSLEGVTKNTGNIVPVVNMPVDGMLEGSDANWTNLNDNYDDRSAKRSHLSLPGVETFSNKTSDNANALHISIARHISLLQPSSTDGALLRSIYELTTNGVLNLPPIPTDEEYCERLSLPPSSNHNNPNKLPTFDLSALRAARFAELSLGALANEQASLAMELSNASTICLRDCVDKPAHTSCLYELTRAYLLLGIFRSLRGDMVRYFKYRRVCLMQISKLDSMSPNKSQLPIEALLAAISFHDAWVYIMHNGEVDSLPNIDEFMPPICNKCTNTSNAIHAFTTTASSIATNPINQMWMQGSPPVFLNNEANLITRSIDAFSCAVRTCCDHANTNFEDIAKASGIGSPTYSAVLANEKQLCTRNIVMSAKTFLDQYTNIAATTTKKHGLYFVAYAMSAFVENSQSDHLQEGSGVGESKLGSFTPLQIKNLFAACDIIIQHPLLLHSPGPVYHMAGNAAVLMCHLLNAIYSKYNSEASKQTPQDGCGMTVPINMADSILFDDALDTFITMRMILNIHRKTLPVKLRCHALPRPSGLGLFKRMFETVTKVDGDHTDQEFFIDLGQTAMCPCRGCQGFVLMGCSPCVAAERIANAAQNNGRKEIAGDFLTFHSIADVNNEHIKHRQGQEEFNYCGENSDDDDLLAILSKIIKE